MDDPSLAADARERRRAERRAARAHDHRGPGREPTPGRLTASPAGRLLVALAGLTALGTLVALVVLWPGHVRPTASGAQGGATTSARVTATRTVPCAGPTPQRCRRLVVAVRGGRAAITLGPVGATTADPSPGTRVRVAAVRPVGGQRRLPAGAERWSYVGLDRRGGLGLLVALLLVGAVVVVRLRGLLAALGVGLSLAVVVGFVVPALLAGEPAVPVALTGALAVLFVTVGLTNGLSAQSLAAALGVTATLGVTCALAELAVHLVALDGRSTELAQYLAQQDGHLQLRGVVLAGMLIGALGVLADTAVTQASAVTALRRADPGLDARGLYRSAFVVGRDHLSATIHTLVLAYAGSALPLLLLLRSSAVSATDALSTQDVAEPVAAALVGCLGLLAAVPITTALAALLVSRTPPDALPAGHAHAH